jgi:hypothetical protein
MILILLVCGIIALVQGEAKLGRNRTISRSKGRAIGVLMLIGGVILPFLVGGDAGQYIAMATALLTFSIGLAVAQKVE